MARRTKFTADGARVMSAAGSHLKIFGVPELAERSGVPYQTLRKRLSVDFGRTTVDDLRALVRTTRMTDTELVELVRGG